MTAELKKLKKQLEGLFLKEGLSDRVIVMSERLDALILEIQKEKLELL